MFFSCIFFRKYSSWLCCFSIEQPPRTSVWKSSCPTGCQEGFGWGSGQSAFGQVSSILPRPGPLAPEIKQTFLLSANLAGLLVWERSSRTHHTSSDSSVRFQDDIRLQGDAVEAGFMCEGHRRLTPSGPFLGFWSNTVLMYTSPFHIRVNRQSRQRPQRRLHSRSFGNGVSRHLESLHGFWWPQRAQGFGCNDTTPSKLSQPSRDTSASRFDSHTHVAHVPTVPVPGFSETTSRAPNTLGLFKKGYAAAGLAPHLCPLPAELFSPNHQISAQASTRPLKLPQRFKTCGFPWVPAPCAGPLLTRRAVNDFQLLSVVTLASLRRRSGTPVN